MIIPLKSLFHLPVGTDPGETDGAGGDASTSHFELCGTHRHQACVLKLIQRDEASLSIPQQAGMNVAYLFGRSLIDDVRGGKSLTVSVDQLHELQIKFCEVIGGLPEF